MPLRLITMRHAKSRWGDPLVDDFDRVLNERGRSAAAVMGQWLRGKNHLPDLVFVSAAKRTLETCERVFDAAGHTPQISVFDSLYHANDFQILRHIKKADCEKLMIIGHNPGIGDFASHFAKSPSKHPDFMRYPTAATTVFEVEAGAWPLAKFGENTIADFAIPREIEAK